MAKVPNGVEKLPKFQPTEQAARTLQTNGRWHKANVNVRSHSLMNNFIYHLVT